jgi:hypothetical protein
MKVLKKTLKNESSPIISMQTNNNGDSANLGSLEVLKNDSVIGVSDLPN